MRALLALAACAASVAVPAPAAREARFAPEASVLRTQPPSSLVGRWRMVMKDAAGAETRYILEFEIADGELTGSITSEAGSSAPIVDLKLEEGSIRFTVYVYTGDTTIEFSGKVAEKEDRISGTYAHAGGARGTFAAARSS